MVLAGDVNVFSEGAYTINVFCNIVIYHCKLTGFRLNPDGAIVEHLTYNPKMEGSYPTSVSDEERDTQHNDAQHTVLNCDGQHKGHPAWGHLVYEIRNQLC
jgi:hypothetical protein